MGTGPVPSPDPPPMGTEPADADTTGASMVPAGASPIPDEMCHDGQVPQAAAYDLDDGTFRWVSCTDGNAYRYVREVTADAVYVQSTAPEGGVIALDPADGHVLTDAPALPVGAIPETGLVEVDGLFVSGGQEGPISVSDASGDLSWSRSGRWVYDDVWAIDDGAVFAIENVPLLRLVAYELETGDVRWEYSGDPYNEGLWPWHAQDGRLFTAWDNLQVRDTQTGDLIWRTTYPSYPLSANQDLRLAGVKADDQAVYVGFGTAASGGD
jgi:outer membrane protein assembly factor BamB